MSAVPARLPRSAWLAAGTALGAFGGAAVTAGPEPAGAALVAGLGLAAVGAWIRGRSRAGRGVELLAAGIGLVLVALRILVGPAPGAPPPLPADSEGPWLATVESVGSPRNGDQVARLRLGGAKGTVVVAATLPAYPDVAAGTLVEVSGRLRPPPDDDPYGEYLRRTGASGSLDGTGLRVLEPGPPATLQALRDGAGDALRLALPEPEAGLAAGILIGLRERVDRDLAGDFATAGTSHVVAISGWNIAIVAGIVGALMRGRPRRLVAVVVGGTIAAYVVVAGASPSVVRAAVMASVVLVARESGRAGRAPAALAWAAALLLLAEPGMIEDAGFRLSVMATAGLLAWATPLGRRIGAIGGGRMPGWLAESLGISLAAQAATLPDVLATFGRLSLVSPAVNLLVVPLVPVAMAGGVLALAGGALVMLGAPAWIATLAGLPGWLVLHLMVAFVRAGAGLPFAAVELPPGLAAPAGLAAALALAVVVAWLRRRGRPRGRHRHRRAPRHETAPAPATRPARAGRPPGRSLPRLGTGARALLVALLVAVTIGSAAIVDAATRETRLVVLDIGQGDAILLESHTGARMLVDGGPDPQRLLVELDARIPPWDRRIDIVVLTHPHEDHVAGLAGLLDRYLVRHVYELGMHGPGPGWAAWNARLADGPPRGLLANGAQIRLGEISLRVLWPDAGTVPVDPPDSGAGINNESIVLLGEANRRRFLLTGDAEQDIDPLLLARGLPRLDVLKVAHHGSATATTQALLAATRPAVAVISVGAGNTYGHPAPTTLARLRAAGSRVYRTDRDGSVEIDLREAGTVVHASGSRGTGFATPTSSAGSPAPSPSPAGPVGFAAYGAARAAPLGYDPSHDRPWAPRGRPPVAVPGTTRLVPAAFVRRRGRGLVARGTGGGEGAGDGRDAGLCRGAAARRGQAASGPRPGPSPPRRGLRGLARRSGLARAG